MYVGWDLVTRLPYFLSKSYHRSVTYLWFFYNNGPYMYVPYIIHSVVIQIASINNIVSVIGSNVINTTWHEEQ